MSEETPIKPVLYYFVAKVVRRSKQGKLGRARYALKFSGMWQPQVNLSQVDKFGICKSFRMGTASL
jgi:hypothetical protein